MDGERNFTPEAMAMSTPERRDTANLVPESEIIIEFARSSGAGGQNVNKRDTKAVLHWNVGASASFSEEEKALIRKRASNRLNSEDEIVLFAQEERSQLQNKTAVVERLQALVRTALTPQEERKPTKPTRAAKRSRLEDKAHQSRKKAMRDPKNW